MTRAATACLFLLVLAPLSLPVLSAQGRPDDPGSRGREMAQEDHGRFEALPQEARAMALERGGQAKLFAGLSYDNGTLSGRFVSAALDPANGTLTEFRHVAWNTTVFARVTAPDVINASDPRVTGSILTAASDDLLLRVHNNPVTGLFIFSDAARTVTFELAAGVTIGANTPDQVVVHVPNPANASAPFHGHVVAHGPNVTLAANGASVVATLTGPGLVTYLSHPGRDTVFAPHPDQFHQGTVGLARAGRLGTQLAVVNASGEPVGQQMGVDIDARPERLERGRLVVAAEGDAPGPRAVVLDIAADVVPATHPGAVAVLLDGRPLRIAPLVELTTLTEAVANVSITAGTGAQVIVLVPSWSLHTIEITSTEAEPEPVPPGQPPATPPEPPAPDEEEATPVAGLVPVAAALAAAAVALRRRR